MTSWVWLRGFYQWKSGITSLFVRFGIYHPCYFLSILKSPRASARVISKLIKNNKGDISQISRTAMRFLINHIFTNKHHAIASTTSNQWGDYKTEGDYKTVGWLQIKQLTSPVQLHKEIWLVYKSQLRLIIWLILQKTTKSGLITPKMPPATSYKLIYRSKNNRNSSFILIMHLRSTWMCQPSMDYMMQNYDINLI